MFYRDHHVKLRQRCYAYVMLVATLVVPESLRLVEVVAQQARRAEQIEWRRTKHGWEDARTWFRPATELHNHGIGKIHPLAFGMIQLLVSLGALVTFASKTEFEQAFRWRKSIVRKVTS